MVSLCFQANWLLAQSGVSVLNFGAVADGVMRTDGAMTVGSATLSSASGSFSSNDVGKYIQVIGAGPGGSSHSDGAMAYGSAALTSGSGTFSSSDIGRGIVVVGAGSSGGNLVTTIQSYNSSNSVVLGAVAQYPAAGNSYFYGAMTLEGTIQSVQSSTTVTLSTAALGTISSAIFAYGTDNHSQFQTALDTTGQAGGGVVNVPAPTSCPSGAVCGYVVKATDQMTANAPGAVKIRYNNVSLIGSSPQTNLFCRGAYGSYTNTVAFPGTTGYIRGFCLTIGDNGGPNGAAGEAVSNVTVSNLHLYGMTNGNTFNVNFGYPPQSPTGDGWDVTHKAIYMWDNSSFSNITINSVYLQDFKAENIYSGGSVITGMVIENSTITNFNGNGISMLAADLQVLNNTISNGSNAAVENSTESTGATALVRQLYQGNTISLMPREGIVVVGVDYGIAPGYVAIANNYFDTIGQTNASGTESAIYIASQSNYVPPANITVSGNTCHDCNSFGVFETSGNTLIQGNNFLVDKYNANNVFGFTYGLTGTTIASNTGLVTANAQASGRSVGAVYVVNPGYASGAFPWKSVVIKGNSWTFPGAPQYEFVTTSGLGWNLVSLDNLNWQGDVCSGCTHADVNHGVVNLAGTTLIEPYGPVVYVMGNGSPVTASVFAGKQENGSQIQIVNTGANAVTFTSDSNMSLTSPVVLAGGSNSSATFTYSSSLGKFSLGGVSGVETVSANTGSGQSAAVNTAFGTALQAMVRDANNNPLSGVNVTFTAPGSGASGAFSGALSTSASTNSSGMATAPVFTANSQPGSYTVTASAVGVTNPANFTLTNTAPVAASITANGGSGQSVTVNTAFATALQAIVRDSSSNPMSGVSVTFTTPSTGASGTFTGAASAAVMTNASGIATAPALTANSQTGGYTVTASVAGVSTSASFNLANTSAGPASISATAGSGQGATVNSGFGIALQARVRDSSSNPMSGVSVTFTAPGSGASGTFSGVTSVTVVTNSSGIATAPALTANSQTGGYAVIASVTGVSTSAIFNLTNTAAGPASVTANAGSGQSTTVNTGFGITLQALVRDSSSNPMSGVSVTFTAPGSGASGTFSSMTTAIVTTNASGIATAPALIANNQTGGYIVTGSVTGVSTSALFSETNSAAVVATAASVSAYGGTGQSATVSTAFGTVLQALVRDSSSNPMNGVTVTFSAPGSGASGSFGGVTSVTAATNSSGIATAPALTANSQSGSFTVTASVSGVSTSASFNLTNLGVSAPSNSGGSLSGSGNSASAAINLTAEGTTDWVHWGDGGGTTVNRKGGVSPQISNFTQAGSGSVSNINNDQRPINWTDGSPTGSSNNNQEALYINNLNTGFSFTVPAGVTGKTLTVHVGGYSSGGTFTAHLSDGSAPDYVDRTANMNGMYDRNYVVTFTAASAGQTLTVSWVDSAGGGNVTLSAAALSGGVAASPSISAASGSGQSATVSTGFGSALQAMVRDSSSNPLSGVNVTFTTPSTGASGTFSGAASAIVMTNSSGIATAPVLTANSQTGSYTVIAGMAGVSANFALTNTAAMPASITASSGSGQNATVNTTFGTTLQAIVRDASSNPMSGVSVTFSAPGSGASGTFSGAASASVVTNSSGVATAPVLTANSQSGAYTVTASVTGISSPASFTMTNTAAPVVTAPVATAASVSVYGGTGQSATVSATFGTVLQALVRDSSTNPMNGVTVTFSAPGSGASGNFGGATSVTAVTNSSGIATAPALTANSQSGSFTVTASVSGVPVSASFSLTNLAVSAPSSSAGALSGMGNSASTAANLTAEGTTDWVHWGDGGGTTVNRKAGVTPQISNFTPVGSGTVSNINNDPRPISWTDGSPAVSSSNNQEALYINNLNTGFSFTVPAGIVGKMLTVHVGGYSSGGTFTAHLSDGSAPDYVDRTGNTNGIYDRNYVVTFNAASAGQTLTITWVDSAGGGNVTLSAAALQ